jgi:soluble lytic murein transglycosylase-like protein
MIKIIIFIGVFLMPIYNMYVSKNTNKIIKTSIKNAITISAKRFKLDFRLIKAIIKAESKFVPFACRYEEHLKTAKWYLKVLSCKEKKNNYSFCSIGEMQILYGNAKAMGFKGSPLELFYSQNNIYYGTRLLKNFCLKYNNLQDAISAYNQGSPRKYKNGRYRNQKYVDTVMKHYRKYGGKFK